MPSDLIKISIWSNNSTLEDYLLAKKESTKVSYTSKKNRASYHLFLIDLEQSLEKVSTSLIETYQYCRENKHKLAVTLLFGEKPDIEQQIYFEKKLSELGGQQPLHRLLLIPCLYFKDGSDLDHWFHQYLLQVFKIHQISISPKGNRNLTPLTYLDFEKALLRSLFLGNTSGRKFYLCGEPVTDLDLAYLLKKQLFEKSGIELDIHTDNKISDSENYRHLALETQATLNWEPESDIAELLRYQLRQIEPKKLESRTDQKSKKGIPKIFQTLKDRLSRHHQKISNLKTQYLLKRLIEEVIAVIFFAYLALSVVFSYTAYSSLKNVEKSLFYLRKGDIQKSFQYLTASKTHLRVSEFNYQYLSGVINFVSSNQAQKSQNLLSFLGYLQKTLESLTQTYNLAEKIYLSIGNSQQSLNYDELTLALKSNLQLSFENISQIEITVSRGQLPKIVEEIIQKNIEYLNLKQIQDQITQLSKIVDLIPPTLSGEIGKNIVVIFQNTHEERSTGGAIEGLLHLTLDQGRFVSQKIYTSSEIDDLGDIESEPPPLVKDLSGNDKWKFRDLNYNPDFPQTAANFQWVIQKNLSFKPDIIIFVTDQIFTDLIETNGLQDQLSRGEAQSAYPKLIEQFTTQLLNHQINFLQLCRSLASAMGNSQILFWTADREIEKGLLSQNYSGSIRHHECHPGVQTARLCLPQTTHLSISNHSIIPLNSYLNHNIRHLIYLEPDKIKHQYFVDYEYKRNAPLLNRNLVEIYQVYFPQGAILKAVLVDNQPVGISSLLAQSEVGLDRYQFPVSTTLNSKHQIIIDFEVLLPEKVKLPIAYSFTEIRQPGSHAPGVDLEINHPLSIRPSIITSEVTTKAGKIFYQFPKKTTTFGVHFVPNQI